MVLQHLSLAVYTYICSAAGIEYAPLTFQPATHSPRNSRHQWLFLVEFVIYIYLRNCIVR